MAQQELHDTTLTRLDLEPAKLRAYIEEAEKTSGCFCAGCQTRRDLVRYILHLLWRLDGHPS